MCKCRSCWWRHSAAARERLPAERRRPSSPPQREHIKRMRERLRCLSAGVKFHRGKKKKKPYYLSDDTFPTSWILKSPLLENIIGKAHKRRWVPAEVMVMLFFFFISPCGDHGSQQGNKDAGPRCQREQELHNCPVTIKLMQGLGIFYFPAFVPELAKKKCHRGQTAAYSQSLLASS